MEADKYFTYEGKYEFDVTKLKDAHDWCQNAVRVFMENKNKRVVVSNTFTQEWEMTPYFELAEKHGYKVYSLICENRHGGINEHGVPEDKLKLMKKRFEIKL